MEFFMEEHEILNEKYKVWINEQGEIEYKNKNNEKITQTNFLIYTNIGRYDNFHTLLEIINYFRYRLLLFKNDIIEIKLHVGKHYDNGLSVKNIDLFNLKFNDNQIIINDKKDTFRYIYNVHYNIWIREKKGKENLINLFNNFDIKVEEIKPYVNNDTIFIKKLYNIDNIIIDSEINNDIITSNIEKWLRDLYKLIKLSKNIKLKNIVVFKDIPFAGKYKKDENTLLIKYDTFKKMRSIFYHEYAHAIHEQMNTDGIFSEKFQNIVSNISECKTIQGIREMLNHSHWKYIAKYLLTEEEIFARAIQWYMFKKLNIKITIEDIIAKKIDTQVFFTEEDLDMAKKQLDELFEYSV